MTRSLVLGYGNPLRGDDGLGWHLAQALAVKIENPCVEIIATHQLTPESAEPIARSDEVFFIDANVVVPPGRLLCYPVEAQTSSQATISHSCSPSQILYYAQILYGSSPRSHVFTIGVKSLEYGHELSPTVRKSLEILVRYFSRLFQ